MEVSHDYPLNSSSDIMTIAAFLLVFLAAFSAGTNAFADANAPVSVVVVTTHNNAQDRIEIQAHDDTQSQSKMVAVDRAEPSVKSPFFAEPFGVNAMPVATGELWRSGVASKPISALRAKFWHTAARTLRTAPRRREPSLPSSRKAACIQAAPASA